MMKPQTSFDSFAALDIRIGKIVKVEDSLSTKPTYRMTIDFGPDIGQKISVGAYRHYSKVELLGQQVIGIVNFAPKKMGPEISEVMILGVEDESGNIIRLCPATDVPLGKYVF